ncbi:MAG: 30S ribosomal protein S12 methylthiotransferase RimO [Oligosphaeraceae bacterium]
MTDSPDSLSQEPLVVHVVALGCAKNLVDAEVMCGTMAAHGIYLTDDPEEAHVFLINTCGFIQSARDEAEHAIKEALSWKKKGMRKGLLRLVVVGGCLAQRSAPEYAVKYPAVDCWMGVDSAPRVHELLAELVAARETDAQTAPRMAVTTATPQWLYDENTPRIQSTPDTYAYVKIAEGCNHRCAFCAIPGIRGNLRSRSPESVLAECRQFLAAGVRELNLIAQDSTAYGLDLAPRATLASLLRQIDALPGDFWVRVLYTHPLHLTEEFLEILGNSRHVVPYLDVPLQHIHTPILKSMRRGLDGEKTRKLLEGIRAKYPRMTIRTTVMTGYPGETPDAFQELLDFVRDFQFDRLGAFAFSPEPGTPAYDIQEGKVPRKTAEARRDKLLALQKSISAARNRALLGTTMPVLLEESLGRRKWLARSQGDAPEVDQTVVVEAPAGVALREGAFLNVKIHRASEYDLGAVPAP